MLCSCVRASVTWIVERKGTTVLAGAPTPPIATQSEGTRDGKRFR